MIGLGLWLGIGGQRRGGTPTLAFAGNPFPVTLKRSATEYYVVETGAAWLGAYAGPVRTVAASGAEHTTLDSAIAASSDGDVISIAPGQYAMPSASISKSVALVAPSGGVFLGVFLDLSAATITNPRAGVYNIAGITPRAVSLCRKTEEVDGTRGFARCRISADMDNVYVPAGLPSVFAGSTSTNVSTGTDESLPSLVARGELLAWSVDALTGIIVNGGSVYIGSGITLASNAPKVVLLNGGQIVMDGAAAFGGTDSVFSSPEDGTSLLFNSDFAGSFSDNIDYRGTAKGVEVGLRSLLPGGDTAANATTAHVLAKVLRVGGEYGGGSRVVHDVNNSNTYTFSSLIRDPLFFDKWGIAWGSSATTNQTAGAYGDLTFEGTFGQQIVIDPSAAATVQEIGLTDPWTLA